VEGHEWVFAERITTQKAPIHVTPTVTRNVLLLRGQGYPALLFTADDFSKRVLS
jgi:hypothetical protein